MNLFQNNLTKVNNISNSLIIDDQVEFVYDEGIYSTNGLGNKTPHVNYQYSPTLWTDKDKSFGCWQQRGGEPYNNESMVYCFDHITKKISASYPWGEITPPDDDGHLMPSVITTNDGRLLLMEENPHNGPIWIKKSGLNHNIINVSEFGNYGDRLSYPNITKFKDNTLFCITRQGYVISDNSDAVTYSANLLHKSVDSGSTWEFVGNINSITERNSGNLILMYAISVPTNDDTLRIFVNKRLGRDPIVSYPELYYFESKDGIIWSNVEGSYKVNITSFSINEHNLENFFVMRYGDGTMLDGRRIQVSGSCVIDGKPAFVCRNEINGRPVFGYWNGVAWVNKGVISPIEHPPFYNDSMRVMYKNGTIFFVSTYVGVSGNAVIALYKSIDMGDSWTFVENLSPDGYDCFNAKFSHNIEFVETGLFSCVVRYSDQPYSDLFIREFSILNYI